MTVTEVINKIKEIGEFTDDNLIALEESLLNANITDFKDEQFKEFTHFVNAMPYDERIQTIITKIVEQLNDKGVMIPCGGGCDDDCAFHESEFDN